MKYFVAAIVTCMICILPLGSWYYLQTGLDYRKQALADLEPKGVFDVADISMDELKSKTTFIQNKEVKDDVLDKIYEQYGTSETFQMWTTKDFQSEEKNWKALPSGTSLDLVNKYPKDTYFLIDTSGQLRNTYAGDAEGLIKVIEHIAIVLPRVKELDVKMKSDRK